MKSGSTHRIAELDGLRGIAVLMVMLFHFEGNPTAKAGGSLQWLYLFIIHHLWSGVDLFFVLSGFLITGILLRTRETGDYFKCFYGKRALRILPVALIAITGWFWVATPVLRNLHVTRTFGQNVTTGADLPWSTQLWYFSFLQNWLDKVPPALGHLWSLAVEEQFYLVWPIVVLVSYRRLDKICIATVILSFLFRLGLFYYGLPLATIHRLTFSRIDQLAVGAALAFQIYRNEPTLVFKQLLFPAIAGLAVIAGIEIENEGLGADLTVIFTPLLWALTFAGLIAWVVDCRFSWLSGFLKLPFLRSMGQYSYAMYIVHFPVFIVLRLIFRNQPGFWREEAVIALSGILISWILGWISWNLIERRFLALKDRLWPPTNIYAGPDKTMMVATKSALHVSASI